MNTPAPPPDDTRAARRWRTLAALAFVAVVAGLVALAVVGALRPSLLEMRGDGWVTCPFKIVTGLRCPLCGMTRATALLFRGQLAPSLAVHPLAPLVLLALAVWLLGWLFFAARGVPRPPWFQVRLWLALLLVAAAWAVNLAFGTG